MQATVYDTYVKRKDGVEMHFDVLIDDNGESLEKALSGAKKYLDSVGETGAEITSEQCRRCHVTTPTVEQVKAISESGYFILKMGNNCL